MLTPSFNISQNDEYVFIKIIAPYTQLKEVEINVIGSVFWFYSSPYFLRLHFPCGVVDDDEPPTSFNSDKGEFEVRLCKEQVGQHFPDLDLLATLLAPKAIHQNIKPSIEVLTDCPENQGGGKIEEDDDDDEDEWLLDQELPHSEAPNPLTAPKYGFGNLTSGVFGQVKAEFKEIIDLPDPDKTPVSQRHELRIAEENDKFSADHYLADFMEPEVLQEYLHYSPPWSMEISDGVKLSNEEKECLKKLGNKEYLLSKADKAGVFFSLVDILFAFAYNHRTTLGENSVESAWTINKLSATLSWLNIFTSLHDVLVNCFRRSLTYPLYRNWNLAQLVLKDTISILKLGRRRVLKCLLEIHSLFSSSEPRYLLNQLYISDYCIWLQHASERKLSQFVEALSQIHISKNDVGLELVELEQAAMLVQEETLVNEVQKLTLQTADESSATSDSESSSSSEERSSLDSDDDSSVN